MLHGRGRVLGRLEREIGPFGLSVALASAHRGVNAIQAVERIRLLTRQFGEHERDVVAEHICGAAHADRDHRLQCRGPLPVVGQVRAHPSGHGREHHVVDRGPVGALDGPQILKWPLGPGEAAQRREGVVEGTRRRGGQQRMAERAGQARGLGPRLARRAAG